MGTWEEEGLQFHELEEDCQYRMILPSGDSYNYKYELVGGELWNVQKQKQSSWKFNSKIRFKLVSRKKIKRYKSLDLEVEFNDYDLKVGCQTIKTSDAMLLAMDIWEHFTFKD